MRYVGTFWGGKDMGGMFSNSNDPFGLAAASHALTVQHVRRGMFLREITLAGRNLATNAKRVSDCREWVENCQPQPGDIFYLVDVNLQIRYAMIVCVGEKRGNYDY